MEKNVDLIIIDMQMEMGMNGYETYREIIKIYPEQKALIVLRHRGIVLRPLGMVLRHRGIALRPLGMSLRHRG
ncbi:MAG: DNA-binding response regulator [Candidatus Electrothrix sp. AS4_5]|nr:DNA-binding response regulator [Candidatus Electrothrix gigas]